MVRGLTVLTLMSWWWDSCSPSPLPTPTPTNDLQTAQAMSPPAQALVTGIPTSFPTTVTSMTTSYVTTTIYPNFVVMVSELRATYRLITTIMEEWLTSPTSFPYTVTQTATWMTAQTVIYLPLPTIPATSSWSTTGHPTRIIEGPAPTLQPRELGLQDSKEEEEEEEDDPTKTTSYALIPYWVPDLAIPVIPTNLPTTITVVGTRTFHHSASIQDPFLGPGYNIRTGPYTLVESVIEEWPSRLTSLPFPVKGSKVSTMTITDTVSRFLFGQGGAQWVTTTSWTSTGMQTEFTRVLQFSLTSFPTAVTSTYTSTSTTTSLEDGTREVHATYVIVETVTEKWPAEPTSFPFTLTQTAVAMTIQQQQQQQSAIDGSPSARDTDIRTYHPTLVVGSIPKLAERMSQASARPPRTATIIPTFFPTAITSSWSSSVIYRGIVSDIFLLGGSGFTSWKGTSTIFETVIQPWPTGRPTSVPFTVPAQIITSASGTATFGHHPSRAPGMTTDFPPDSTLPGETWTRAVQIWNTSVVVFPYASLTRFPTTLTRTYTTSAAAPETTTNSWHFGLPPPTTVSWPVVETIDATTTVVEAVTEEWPARPTSFPHTLTQTAVVTTTLIRYFPGGLTAEMVHSRTHHPTLVVGQLP